MLNSLLLRVAFIAESLRFTVPVRVFNQQPAFAVKRELAKKRMKIRAVQGNGRKMYNRRGVRSSKVGDKFSK